MSKFFEFSNVNPLIVLDMANNHNGSLKHGKQIIDEISEVTKRFPFRFCLKFQYRDLPNFIHRQFQNRNDIAYVDRFLTTKLSWDDFAEMKIYAEEKGLLTACTPFDEYSVDKIISQDFDFLKIASASFSDWPLIEKVSSWTGPIIASTAGATLSDIDRVVTFLTNRKKDFALMHCVAAYPTEDKDLQLNRIASLKKRFLNIPIGYSTHESPENVLAACLGLSAGASILERHVGSSNEGTVLNKYSSEKSQLVKWLNSIEYGITMLGSSDSFSHENKSESEALHGLRRFAFSKSTIKKGSKFNFHEVYFAIPGSSNQYSAKDFGKYSIFEATKDIIEGEAISDSNSRIDNSEDTLFAIRESVLKFIKNTGIVIPTNAALEISHHYGIDSFYKFGSCMITVVNKDYCKKYIIMLPGQDHPDMYHKIKDETFFLLTGDLMLRLNDKEITLREGETCEIPPLAVHGFKSNNGAIIEEVSTKHTANDSFYVDDFINKNSNRKTIVRYWL